MGKLTISMAIFNSYVSLPEGKFKVPQFYAGPIYIHLATSQGLWSLFGPAWLVPENGVYRYTMIYRLYPPQF